MSTETTNKKIKIDNGITFGRTYTDKAVDELLKNIGSGNVPTIDLETATNEERDSFGFIDLYKHTLTDEELNNFKNRINNNNSIIYKCTINGGTDDTVTLLPPRV